MKTKRPLCNLPGLLTGVLLACTLRLPAQSPPVITTQPAGQTNLVGTTANVSVAVSGAGPFTYQWRYNGANLPNGFIITVAGNGSAAYAGDGGPATNASLHLPMGVAFDGVGNLYIADTYNSRLRQVNPNGFINTVAGNGAKTFAGDGGAATSASLNSPTGVALDAFGNLYIADKSNQRIREVGANGRITTVAGYGNAGYSGDGGPATNASLNNPVGVVVDASGNLYIADQFNNRIRRVGTNGIITSVAGNGTKTFAGDGGAATNASLAYPTGVALDPLGNLYIADSNNQRIRQVATNGLITTVAGNGLAACAGDGGAATNASLNDPYGVALDAFGNLYVADNNNQRIREVAANGLIITVAGGGGNYPGDGGAPTNASMNNPCGVAVDPSGNLCIANESFGRIQKVWLYAGYSTLTLGQVTAANAGDYSVVISNSYGSITSAVTTLTVLLPPAITTQPAGQFAAVGSSPAFSVAVTGVPPFGYSWYFNGTNLVQSGTNNTLTLSDISTNNAGNYTVVITNLNGSVTSRAAALTVGFPPSVTAQPASQTNLAGTKVNFTVTPGGTGPFAYLWQFNDTSLPNNLITTVPGTTGSDEPECVTFDAAGNLYIADTESGSIVKVATNGLVTTVANAGAQPTGVAVDAAGNLYIACWYAPALLKVGTNGSSANLIKGINAITGVALDAAGDLYVADEGANLILMMNPDGLFTTVAGPGPAGIDFYSGDGGAATNANLNFPFDVALDAAGNLYISDQENNRIRKVDTNGIITTVAGNGTNAFAGDGGPATNASLFYPRGVALDSIGNLYFADWLNNRIRKVDTNGIISTVAGNGQAVDTGDGGAATNATLNGPQGVAVNACNLYIADAGNNRIREVHLAGFPALTLTNVTATNAGNYSVVITNPYGSVTSGVVSLTVTIPTTPPQIISSGTNFGLLTNQFGFNLNGAYGQTIVVDGSTNLLDWTPLFTNTANGSPFSFSDPAWTNFPWRFYRARLP